MDDVIVEPDEGYDALKKITINVNIQPPEEHNIEEVRNYILKELSTGYNIRPSKNYDYMQEVNINTEFRVTNINLGYTLVDPEWPDYPYVVNDRHYFTDSIKRKAHKFIAEEVKQYHLRIGFRLVNINNVECYEIFMMFAAQGPIKYICDYNYRYIDVNTEKEKWIHWKNNPWRLEGDDNNIIAEFGPYFSAVRGGKRYDVQTSKFKLYLERNKYHIIVFETEDEDIYDIENKNPDLEVEITSEEIIE